MIETMMSKGKASKHGCALEAIKKHNHTLVALRMTAIASARRSECIRPCIEEYQGRHKKQEENETTTIHNPQRQSTTTCIR